MFRNLNKNKYKINFRLVKIAMLQLTSTSTCGNKLVKQSFVGSNESVNFENNLLVLIMKVLDS